MRKPFLHTVCENKGADELRGNIDFGTGINTYNSSTAYIRDFTPLIILCGCTARLMSGSPEDTSSRDEAHFMRWSMEKCGKAKKLTTLCICAPMF